MRLLHYFFCFLIFYVHTTISTEYMYPVGSLDDEASILYIHQQSSGQIELFKWNTKTNHTEQILWSVFNPTSLQLLPNKAGFSFIDNGRLRIKLFQKRAPKTIEFDEPLFNINTPQWIDNDTCCCSAQKNDCFSLFELHDNGNVDCLITKDHTDCMYPQKINHLLFYIERFSEGSQYNVVQTEYPSSRNKNKNVYSQSIVSFNDKPIVFLNMQSETEGFVLEHSKSMDSECKTMLFFYHHLVKKGDVWNKKVLFSFRVPAQLLLGQATDNERLVESILPLLPRIADNKIYFVSCSQNKILEPYFYDLLTMQHKKIILPVQNEGHFFVPMPYNQKLCFGGTKSDQETPLVLF